MDSVIEATPHHQQHYDLKSPSSNDKNPRSKERVLRELKPKHARRAPAPAVDPIAEAKTLLMLRKNTLKAKAKNIQISKAALALKIDAALVFLCATGLVIACLQFEMDAHNTLITSAAQTVVSAVTICLLYVQQLTYDTFGHAYVPYKRSCRHYGGSLISANFLVQAIVCSMHSPPGVANTSAVATTFARSYLLLRLVQFHSISRAFREALLEQGVLLGSFRAFKHMFVKRPWTVIIPFDLAVVVGLAYLMMKLEGEENPEFFFYRDNIWHIVIVATTVGFGDIFATSMQGRAVTVITALLGLIMSMFFLTGVLETLKNDELDVAAAEFAAAKAAQRRLEESAQKLLAAWWKRRRLEKGKTQEMTQIPTSKLLSAKKKQLQALEAFKSLAEQAKKTKEQNSAQSGEVDPNKLAEEVKKIKAMVESTARAQKLQLEQGNRELENVFRLLRELRKT